MMHEEIWYHYFQGKDNLTEAMKCLTSREDKFYEDPEAYSDFTLETELRVYTRRAKNPDTIAVVFIITPND